MDLPELFPRPQRPTRFWYRRGAPGGEGPFNLVLAALLVLFAAGWSWGIAVATASGVGPTAAARLTGNPFGRSAPPETAFLMDALVRSFTDATALRGISGDVRVLLGEPGEALHLPIPDSLPEGVVVELRPVRQGGVDLDASGIPVDSLAPAPEEPGVWALTLRQGAEVEEIPDVRVIVQVPASARRSGKIGAYRLGEWPFENGRRPPSEAYATPEGLVEVRPEDIALPVSEHFVLGDFLTKGQTDVWPKYVVMSPRLLDKLELTLRQLESEGHPVENAGVISGFRTPWYNAHGGNTQGRGSLSRHMYGDAMDFYVDNDGDGRMDDLNGDGRVDIEDARVLAAAAAEVERRHPQLVGGVGVYAPTGAHAGFVHVDTRGYRARW